MIHYEAYDLNIMHNGIDYMSVGTKLRKHYDNPPRQIFDLEQIKTYHRQSKYLADLAEWDTHSFQHIRPMAL